MPDHRLLANLGLKPSQSSESLQTQIVEALAGFLPDGSYMRRLLGRLRHGKIYRGGWGLHSLDEKAPGGWSIHLAAGKLVHSKVVRSMQYARGRMRNGHKFHASISEQRDGYRVTISITERKRTRELITRTVPSRFDAETIAGAFASLHDVPWHKVRLFELVLGNRTGC